MESTEVARARQPLGIRRFVSRTVLLATLGVVVTASAVIAGTSGASLAGGGATSMTVVGITGGGTPKGPGYIDVLSWSWGVSNNIGSQSSGSGAGKVSMSSFTIMKTIDKASPLLWKACAAGSHLATVTLFMDPPSSSTGAPGGDNLVVTLTDARVHGVTTSSGGDRPTESVSFTYAKIKMDYTPQGSSSPVTFTWDLKTNKGG
jgi:type VI secretion system secreted protein Hcp